MKEFLKSRKATTIIMSSVCLVLLYVMFIAFRGPAGDTDPAWARLSEGNSNSYGAPVRLADLENRSINESSGIAASRRNRELLWTNNDSGDGPFVYAFDRQGKDHGVWRVAGAQALDWEDMAIGPGPKAGQSYLYTADIGDNSSKRDHITVYRVVEPLVAADDKASTMQKPGESEQADAIQLRYPDGKHDAEALLIHPQTGDLYIVSKVRGAPAGVYKLKAPFSGSELSTLVRVGEVKVPNHFIGWITGGDISPDGRSVVLCDYVGAYEFVLPDQPGVGFDEIWKQPPMSIILGARPQGEAICYRADGMALLATSEGAPCPLIEVPRHK